MTAIDEGSGTSEPKPALSLRSLRTLLILPPSAALRSVRYRVLRALRSAAGTGHYVPPAPTGKTTRRKSMETIDLTPTPLEYARIARRMIEGAYGLDAPAGLTNYQVLWAWQAAENTAEFIGASTLAELRRGLAEELLRHYLARAQDRPAIVITTETTYDDLKAENIRTEN